MVQGGDNGRYIRRDRLDVPQLEVAHGVVAVDELLEHLRSLNSANLRKDSSENGHS